MIALAGGDDIKCAEYATFGTKELSRNILTALEMRKACLMSNHGQVAFGKNFCLLYTSPSPRDATLSRMPSSA